MAAFRSFTILAQLFAVLAFALAAREENRHDKAWNVLSEGIQTSSLYLTNFFATESYNVPGIAEPRLLKSAATASDDDSSTSLTGPAANEPRTTAPVTTDDGSYMNKTSIIPPEHDQPKIWPATVLGLFLVLAVILLGMAAYNNFKKRSHYEEV
jgi:hypothetical protein